MLGAGDIRRLMEAHGIGADRRLGQNFVTDPNIVRRIVSIAGVGPGSRVLEVGPGVGSLTLALAESGAKVTAIEKDPSLLGVLDEVLAHAPAEHPPVVELGDALDVEWEPFLAARSDGHPAPWTVVANLPYNVAVPIIVGLLEGAPSVSSMFVMVQLEVAERLCAQPGGRVIGVPTIRVAWHAEASIAMTVPPEVFTPRPRVRSAVVAMHRRPVPVEGVDEAAMFEMVGRAYRQRRKMLRSSLASAVPASAFDAAGVDPRSRPEELSVSDWGRLALELQRL